MSKIGSLKIAFRKYNSEGFPIAVPSTQILFVTDEGDEFLLRGVSSVRVTILPNEYISAKVDMSRVFLDHELEMELEELSVESKDRIHVVRGIDG